MYFHYVGPQLDDLKMIVVPRTAAHWITLATFLDFEVARVELIKRQCCGSPRDSCIKVFNHWLTSDEGISPKTWGVLLEILKEIENLTSVTEKIEEELIQR